MSSSTAGELARLHEAWRRSGLTRRDDEAEMQKIEPGWRFRADPLVDPVAPGRRLPQACFDSLSPATPMLRICAVW